ncbi:MAG: hypothetical protein ACQETK_05855 [Pseudomonadota bacterium]
MPGNRAAPKLNSRPWGAVATAMLVALFAAGLDTPVAQAEILRGVEGEFTVRQGDGLPARGQSRTRVEREFGAPQKRHTPVGDPPITRWDYADFSVVFEGDHVLHSIVHGEHSARKP